LFNSALVASINSVWDIDARQKAAVAKCEVADGGEAIGKDQFSQVATRKRGIANIGNAVTINFRLKDESAHIAIVRKIPEGAISR